MFLYVPVVITSSFANDVPENDVDVVLENEIDDAILENNELDLGNDEIDDVVLEDDEIDVTSSMVMKPAASIAMSSMHYRLT